MRVSRWKKSGGFVVVLAFAASLGAAGCGKSTGSLSGKVYYKGAPLKGGHVIFACADGKTEQPEIGEDGSYRIDKLPVGVVKVGVETDTLKPKGVAPGMAGPVKYAPPSGMENPNQAPDPAQMAKRYVPIPEKYADPQSSGLTFTVKPGSQPYDINLD